VSRYFVDQVFGNFPKAITQNANQGTAGTSINVLSTNGILEGMSITGDGISPDTTITSVVPPNILVVTPPTFEVVTGKVVITEGSTTPGSNVTVSIGDLQSSGSSGGTNYWYVPITITNPDDVPVVSNWEITYTKYDNSTRTDTGSDTSYRWDLSFQTDGNNPSAVASVRVLVGSTEIGYRSLEAPPPPPPPEENIFDVFLSTNITGLTYTDNWIAIDSNTAIKNNSIPEDGGVTSFSITTTGPCNISFDWKISSEENCDIGSFYINDILQDDISGEINWITQVYNLNQSGTLTLKWEYLKDDSVTEGDDSFCLRNLVIGAYISPAWEELPLATMPWSQGSWNGTAVVTGMPGQILSDIHSANTVLVDKLKAATKIRVTYTSPKVLTLDVGEYGTVTSYSFGQIVSGMEYTMPTNDMYTGYRLDFREGASWSSFSISKIEIITL